MGELKHFTDIKDELLIYEIDTNEQYVFKTSTTKMKIDSEINPDSLSFLTDEYCFFDGNHKRVRDFVTLAASFYHPLLQSQVVLATMNCKHENHKFVGIFWQKI